MNEWFKANKPNTKKSVFSLYHKSTQKDNLPPGFSNTKNRQRKCKGKS